MIENFSKRIIIACQKAGYATEAEGEVLQYELVGKLEAGFCIVTILFAGLIAGHLLEFSVFVLIYRLLRRHSGGYHMDHFWVCYLISLLITCACSIVQMAPVWVLVPLLLASNILIIVLGPVNHPDYDGTESEMKHHKAILRAELGILDGICFVCLVLNVFWTLTSVTIYAIICVASLVCIAKIKHQEVRHEH